MYLSTSDIQYYSLGKAGVVLVPNEILLKAILSLVLCENQDSDSACSGSCNSRLLFFKKIASGDANTAIFKF